MDDTAPIARVGHLTPRLSRYDGFTLIELVIIIVILGLISAIAIPNYQDINVDARIEATRASVMSLREGINIYYSHAAATTGTPQYPLLDSLSAPDIVMQRTIPPNPFQPNAPDSIVEGFVKGEIVGTRGGWAYKPSTGEIWANTSSTRGGGGCASPDAINENLF